MKNQVTGFLLVVVLAHGTVTGVCQQNSKPRTVITTDGEVDDVDSFIRMLLYTNEFNVVGLVYSSSQWHYSGDGKGTTFTSEMPYTAERYGKRTDLRWPGTDWMELYIRKYAQVYPNLLKHSEGYPTPESLLNKIRIGNIEFEGEMEKNTPGSEYIKDILLDNDPSPVYLQIWGGTNTVARALKSIEGEYKSTAGWKEIYRKVSAKAILYTVLDQDATYKKYVAPNWPDIKVFYNSAQFWSFAYLWPRVVPDQLKPSLGGKWFAENILFNHGPLLESYYTWGDGRQLAGDPEHTHGDIKEAEKYKLSQYDFISEGDSPAYFFLLDVGLRSMEDPSYGGWGGRMVQSKANPKRWEDGEHVTDYNIFTSKDDTAYPQTRWIPFLQNDFAARADWCVKDVKEANHPPAVKLADKNNLSGKAGAVIKLSGSATDPDGNNVTYSWWQYHEADSYSGQAKIIAEQTGNASFTIPSDARAGDEIHLILEVTDDGLPPLTRFQRVIVKVIK
jgi:hypothetical protein